MYAKYLAWDIEIVKELPEDADWKDHRPLGISCAATFRSGDPNPITWFRVDNRGNKMQPVDLLKMVDYMDEQQALGFIPLTWNGLAFDFDILAEESGDEITCADMAFNHVDMMYHFLKIKGFRLGLNTAAEGLGLSGKTEGMDGSLAPPMWTDNNDRLLELGHPHLARLSLSEKRALILKYVSQDVVTTLEVAEKINKLSYLPWISGSGRPQKAHFPEGLLTVKEARKLSSPNTSWMDNPPDPEDSLAWIVDTGKKNMIEPDTDFDPYAHEKPGW